MTIVDLAKARAYANGVQHFDETAADWIRELADEVASLDRTVTELRALVADVEAESARTQDERDQAIAGLEEVYETVAHLIASLPGEK